MILMSLSPQIVSVSLFCKECKFLPDHEYSSPREKTANVNLCLFCRLRQDYKVHTYVISMEFSAVNRRRPSRETPLGPGAKKDGYFRRLMIMVLYYFARYGSWRKDCGRTDVRTNSHMTTKLDELDE